MYNFIFIITISLGVPGIIIGIINIIGWNTDVSSFLVKIFLTFGLFTFAAGIIFYYFFTSNGDFKFVSRRNKIKKSKLLDFLSINLFVSTEFLLVLCVINIWAQYLSESPIFIFLLLLTAFWNIGIATVYMIKYYIVKSFKKDIQNAFDKRKKELLKMNVKLHSVQDESQSMINDLSQKDN